MTADNGFSIILILLISAIVSCCIFFALKRRDRGIAANKFFIAGAGAGLVVIFVLAKGPLADYYQSMFKDGPYNFSELKSIVFKYGEGDSLVNQFNSSTGEYKYLDRRDSVIKTHLYLTTADLLYLHHKAVEAGFWDFPAKEINTDTTNLNGRKPTEYLIEFNYRHKSKSVLFGANYNGPQQLVEANRLLIQEIQTVLTGAEERQKK